MQTKNTDDKNSLENFSASPPDPDDKLFASAESGNIDELSKLISAHRFLRKTYDFALSIAAENGFVDIVKTLLPMSNPKAGDCKPLRLANRNGHAEILRLLIPASDPSMFDSELSQAAKRGDPACCKAFIDSGHVNIPYVKIGLLMSNHQDAANLITSLLESGRLKDMVGEKIPGTIIPHRKTA